MGLITFLSDFGYRDHYVAAVKARILQLAPTLPVFDITHGVEPFNIAHAVHVLQAVFRDFPAGTVHLIGVNDLGRGADKDGVVRSGWLAARHEQHYFVAADNGILALLTAGRPDELVRLPAPRLIPLPTRDILTPAAVHLAGGGRLQDLGPATDELYTRLNPQLRLQDHRITGHVVHLDHYGNLITDITRTAVEAVGHGRPGTVHFNRETVRTISPHYQTAPPGDAVCIFNSQDVLCIGVSEGNASELLGMHVDSQVEVQFVAES